MQPRVLLDGMAMPDPLGARRPLVLRDDVIAARTGQVLVVDAPARGVGWP